MHATFSEFVGTCVGDTTVNEHVSEFLNAYVKYVERFGTTVGEGAAVLSGRSTLCCCVSVDGCLFAIGEGVHADDRQCPHVSRSEQPAGNQGMRQSVHNSADSGSSEGVGGEHVKKISVETGTLGCESVRVHENSVFGGAGAAGNSASELVIRGPNYARNKANRDAKKRRRCARRSDSLVLDEKKGFWNSCSEEVRKQLIDSKARMHIADNIRKAKESEMRAKEVGSPYDLMLKAVKMADFAEKQSVNSNTNRVYGWAKTVATSSAESLARSVPSSVPSFQDLVEKLEASSQSSFELDLARKDAIIAELEKKNEELDDSNRELRFQQAANENRFSLLATASNKLRNGVRASVADENKRKPSATICNAKACDDGFVPTRSQPWKHITINRAQVYAE